MATSLSPNAKLLSEIRKLSEREIKEASMEIDFRTPNSNEWKTVNNKRKQRSAESDKVSQESKRVANENNKVAKEKFENKVYTLVLDGVKKSFNTEEKIKNETIRCKPNLDISNIKILKQGGVLISVANMKNYNLAIQSWPKNSFEGDMFITQKNDVRETICINKFSLDNDIDEVADVLNEKNINYDCLRRHFNGRGQPTTLVCFKTDSNNTNNFKKSGINIKNKSFIVRKFVNKETLINRCTKCQKYGHTFTKCQSKIYTCVSCSGNCGKVCKTDVRKCANCNGGHSAAYKGCPIYKSEIKNAEQKLFMKSYKTSIIETEQRFQTLYAEIVQKSELNVKTEKERMDNLYKNYKKRKPSC